MSVKSPCTCQKEIKEMQTPLNNDEGAWVENSRKNLTSTNNTKQSLIKSQAHLGFLLIIALHSVQCMQKFRIKLGINTRNTARAYMHSGRPEIAAALKANIQPQINHNFAVHMDLGMCACVCLSL